MVSIIVPVYNVINYLDRCIASILAQTYREFELILVDDGSTDGSSQLCDFYKERDERVVVIHKTNGGLVSARKAGIVAARGEYIGFVDSDDWIEPPMYERLIRSAVKYQADLVLGGSIEDVGGQTVYKTNWLKTGIYDDERLQKELYPYMICAGNFFCMGIQPYIWNKLMRRELAYPNIMAVDARIRVGEDVAAVMPMLFQAERVIITDFCDYHYCARSASMIWERGNEEKEWNELGILHCFLQSFLNKYTQYNLAYQLSHYSVGNLLTRVYGKLAGRAGEDVLWPFDYRVNSRKLILYSAGNFGRAVYAYLQNCYPDVTELWIDREYRIYQSMGLPVYGVDDMDVKTDADILVAILDVQVVELIKNSLLECGVCREQIYCINITDEDIDEILDSIEGVGGEADGTKCLHSRRTFKGADIGSISDKNRVGHQN